MVASFNLKFHSRVPRAEREWERPNAETKPRRMVSTAGRRLCRMCRDDGSLCGPPKSDETFHRPIRPGIHYGKFEEDCPQGFEMTVESLSGDKTPAAERPLKPENAKSAKAGRRLHHRPGR